MAAFDKLVDVTTTVSNGEQALHSLRCFWRNYRKVFNLWVRLISVIAEIAVCLFKMVFTLTSDWPIWSISSRSELFSNLIFISVPTPSPLNKQLSVRTRRGESNNGLWQASHSDRNNFPDVAIVFLVNRNEQVSLMHSETWQRLSWLTASDFDYV